MRLHLILAQPKELLQVPYDLHSSCIMQSVLQRELKKKKQEPLWMILLVEISFKLEKSPGRSK